MLVSARSFYVFTVVVLILFSGLFLFPGSSSAMQKLEAEDLDSITAGSFSRFTFETDINDISRAKVELNIHAEIYADVDSFKAHYRPTESANGAVLWDQDWRGVTLGESIENPLTLKHFVFEATFDDSISRRLLSIKMGFEDVTGKITIDEHVSFTGTYDNQNFFRINSSIHPGPLLGSEFIFTNDPMHIVFDSKGWADADVPAPPVPPNYNRGDHDLTEFELQPLVRFDFGGAVRNQYAPP